MQARWGTHGDHSIIVLSPWSVREAFDVTVKAVNYAERFRTPVILLTDEIVGHLRENFEPPAQIEIYPRRTPKKTRAEGYQPYAPDDDLVPNIANFGEGTYVGMVPYFWCHNCSFACYSSHTAQLKEEATQGDAESPGE